MITEITGQCQYPGGCERPATHIAAAGNGSASDYCYQARLLCLEHMQMMLAREDADGVEACPNCGCRFGVWTE